MFYFIAYISVIDEKYKIKYDEQYEIKRADYQRKVDAVRWAWSNLQGNTGTFDITLKQSKTLGGNKSGNNKQGRTFDRGDVFKEFA